MADRPPTPEDEKPGEGLTEELVAYLDGELDPKSADSIATRLSLDPTLRSEAESLQRTWDILDVLPRPQPSPTFTTRTLSLAIPAVGSGQSAAFPGQTAATVPIHQPMGASTAFWIVSAVIIAVAGLLGYFVHREVAPSPRVVALDPSLEDMPLMKNMRLYRYVDDMDYLKRLDTAEMFAGDDEFVPVTGQSGLLNPEDPAYLRRQFVWFQAQEPRRQQQLRKLHAEFQLLDAETSARLTRVMQNYNAWLARSTVDQQHILSAPTSGERLEIIRSIREAEWVETLPKPDRDEYARLDGEARRLKVEEWRADAADRREEWMLAQKHWSEHPQGRVPAVFLNQQSREQIEAFVRHLRENLLPEEVQNLEDARAAALEYGSHFGYALEIVRLADRYPILPGSVGPKDWASLPKEVKDYLIQNDKHFSEHGIAAGSELRPPRKAQGRWPAFALELDKYCKKNELKLPVPLGDCRKEQMPPEVIDFIDKTLERELKRTEAGRAELDLLNKAQGRWPEYPQLIMDLSRRHKLSIPGWTLPGQMREWDRFRLGKVRTK